MLLNVGTCDDGYFKEGAQMTLLNNLIIPAVIVLIIFHALIKNVDVFNEFTKGAKDGFATVLNIAPSLIALILSINMLNASGGLDILCNFLSPITSFLGIHEKLTPLAILSPISGSGSVTMYETILKDVGPDSFVGKCASVMMGSTETTLYTMTIYFGSVGIKKSRHTLPCALCADFTSFILSPIMVSIFFN